MQRRHLAEQRGSRDTLLWSVGEVTGEDWELRCILTHTSSISK